jgi:hypothetical protein
MEVSGSRILLSGGSYTAVQVNGSEPLILNNTAYTGGTIAGTVAVLSDVVFGVSYGCTNGTLSDASVYYLSTNYFPISTISTGAIFMPYNATLVGWNCTTYASNTPSTESSTLQISVDGSTTNLSSVINFTNSSGASNTFTASGLSQTIAQGAKVEPKVIMASMTTNPTNAVIGVTFWFVRRQ